MSTHKTWRGKIVYLHDEHGETGREYFTVTRVPNGEQTIRAVCEMDDLDLLRDVTFTVGPNFEARDAFSRITMNDQFVGSGWFRFHGNNVECESINAGAGRITQHVTLDHPTPVFACHPLYVDGWHAAAFDHAKNQTIQTFENCTNSSMKLDGSSPPLIGVVRKKIEYVGKESIEILAGSFEADHYRIHPLRDVESEWNNHPLDFWVYGPDLIFLKLRWDMIQSTYELAEFEG